MFEFSSLKIAVIYFTSGQCKSKVGVVGPLLLHVYSPYSQNTEHTPGHIWTGYTSQWVKLLSKQTGSQHIRRKEKYLPAPLIFYFSSWCVECYRCAHSALRSVIDDKEVANDTWTSSLFTPHLSGDGSLPSEILDVIPSPPEIRKNRMKYFSAV